MTARFQSGLRVCMIAYSFYESDNRVMRYAESLAMRGDRVEVLALRQRGQPRDEVIQGVNVSRIQYRRRNEALRLSYVFRVLTFMLRTTFILSWRHFRDPFQIIHVHSVPDFLVFVAWLPKMCGVPVLLDIHDILPEFYCSKFNRNETSLVFRFLLLFERVSMRFADHVLIANHLWREKITKRSVAPDKCTAMINAPDTRIFCGGQQPRHGDRFIVIYPGSLNHHQGLDIAIRAMARARVAIPHIELHIHGDGSSKDQLTQLARDCSLGETVRFFPAAPLRDIVAHMKNADLGIVPKRADSFGNQAFSTKVLEFMCMGVPVLLSSTMIDRFYFNDSVVTFFKSDDEDALLNGLLALARNAVLRASQAERASAFVQHLTWNVYEKHYLGLLASLLHRSPFRMEDTQMDQESQHEEAI